MILLRSLSPCPLVMVGHCLGAGQQPAKHQKLIWSSIPWQDKAPQSWRPTAIGILKPPSMCPMQPGHLSSTSLLMLCCNGCTLQLAELSSDALCHSLIMYIV